MKQVSLRTRGSCKMSSGAARVTGAPFFHAGLVTVAALWLLSAPGGASAEAAERGQCPAGKEFICGLPNVEDMVRIPNSSWVIASSLAGSEVTGAQLHLIDMRNHAHRPIDPFTAPVRADPQFKECPGKLEPGAFRGHGLAAGTNPLRLYAVNHGGRESVEIFDLVTQGADGAPALRWAGCIVAPADVSINAVTPLPDGGIAVTRFTDRRETQQQWGAKLMAGEATGLVLEWHAGKGWSRVPESEMAGANGLLVSPDGRNYFIAAWSGRRLVRLSRGSEPTRRDSIETDLQPDNLRWDDKGQILVSGPVMKDMPASFACMADEKALCLQPYGVLRVDPSTLKAERIVEDKAPSSFGTATVAIDAGGEWWLGTMRGDRVKRVSKPDDGSRR